MVIQQQSFVMVRLDQERLIQFLEIQIKKICKEFVTGYWMIYLNRWEEKMEQSRY